jgi:hypothetical protein
MVDIEPQLGRADAHKLRGLIKGSSSRITGISGSQSSIKIPTVALVACSREAGDHLG